MAFVTGIDEAGYGPIFGPLVITSCTFSVQAQEQFPESGPSCLWTLLSEACCRSIGRKKAAADRRIQIDDSKLLYKAGEGLAGLERGVLAFLAAGGIRPLTLAQLLDAVAYDESSRQVSRLEWYSDDSGWPPLPSDALPDATAEDLASLERALQKGGVRLEEVRCAVVLADRFNQLVRETGNKGECAWQFVSGHLKRARERAGGEHLWVTLDRQGGRKAYAQRLEQLFAGTPVAVLDEAGDRSDYLVGEDNSGMRVSVRVGADGIDFATALASMFSKYIREQLMKRFHRYWSTHAPEVKPTCGYFGDGTRFLREIEPLISRLGIDRAWLVRGR